MEYSSNVQIRYQMAAEITVVRAFLFRQLVVKYSPKQPRAPAGQPDGGQWVEWDHSKDSAGLYNEANRAKCEAQYESDMFQCTFGASGRSRQACREQALVRHNLCMKDLPIPDLIYLLG